MKRNQKGNNGGATRRSPSRLKILERHKQCLELRKAGLSYETIRVTLGFRSRASVTYAIDRMVELFATPPTEDFINLELLRLDQLYSVFYNRAIGGDLASARFCLEVTLMKGKIQPHLFQPERFIGAAISASPGAGSPTDEICRILGITAGPGEGEAGQAGACGKGAPGTDKLPNLFGNGGQG